MGIKGTCRSGNRGGCPLSYAHYIAGIPFRPLGFPFHPLCALLHIIRAKTHPNGAKIRFYLVCFGVFSGIWETENSKI